MFESANEYQQTTRTVCTVLLTFAAACYEALMRPAEAIHNDMVALFLSNIALNELRILQTIEPQFLCQIMLSSVLMCIRKGSHSALD